MFACLSVFLLSGCGTTVGTNPKTITKGFDNSTQVTINPHGTECGLQMVCPLIGAVWQSTYPDKVILNIGIINDMVNINEIHFNIDGEIIKLKSQQITKYQSIGSTIHESNNSFAAEYEIVNKILNSQRTWIRVATSKGAIEGMVKNGDKDSKSYHALKRFNDQIKEKK